MVCEVRHAEQITYHSYYSGFIPGLDARPDAGRGSAAQRPSSPGASRRSSPVLYPASHEAAAREDYRWDGTEGSVRGGPDWWATRKCGRCSSRRGGRYRLRSENSQGESPREKQQSPLAGGAIYVVG